MTSKLVYEYLDLRSSDIDESSFNEFNVKKSSLSSDVSPVGEDLKIAATGESQEATLYTILMPNNREALLYASKYERDYSSILMLCRAHNVSPVLTGYTNYLIFDGKTNNVYDGLYTQSLPATPFRYRIGGMDGIYTMKTFVKDGAEYLIAEQGSFSDEYIKGAIEAHQLHPI